ncbi:hypothetical protein GGR89_004366 [Sphingomonas trueperi]|uniref:Uncharacterized protein n=1 Tax=Sphingomonas trueperi TaxID=53317 RepID=A0A7X5Y3Y4_9SPHN|nr:hypothetical protein [Sphingomonas trueperi]
MTEDTMGVQALLGKSADADFLRVLCHLKTGSF